MADIRVQDEQGNIHIFPDAATPEMIAKVMGVKPPNQPQPDKGAVTRFLERATGLPVGDIIDNPGKYVNVFGKDYWQAAKDNAQSSSGVDTSRGNPLIPFHQTAVDLKDENYAGALGDIAPGALAVAQIAAPLAGHAVSSPTGQMIVEKTVPAVTGAVGAKIGSTVGEPVTGAAAGAYLGKKISPVVAQMIARFGQGVQRFGVGPAPAPEIIPPRPALPAGPIELPGNLQESAPVPFSNTTRAERLNLLLPEQTPSSKAVALPESSQSPGFENLSDVARQAAARRAGNTPDLIQYNAKIPAKSTSEIEGEGYPEGIQKRPTDRAEITSDKAIEDAMRNNLEQHGWNALSQERKEYFANNAPGLSKGDLIAKARAEAVMQEAQQRAQGILQQAANPPVRYTKTTIPKAKAPTPQNPITTGLDPNQDLVDILQRSLEAVNATKGK